MDNDLDQLSIFASTLIKVGSLKALVLPFTLIRPLGICTQAIQLSILITLVFTLHFNCLSK
jgi:hypothetical protein